MSNIFAVIETEADLVSSVNRAIEDMAKSGTPAALLICDPVASAFLMRNGDFEQWPHMGRVIVAMQKPAIFVAAAGRATPDYPAAASRRLLLGFEL